MNSTHGFGYETQVEEILARMTLREKLGQLHQVPVRDTDRADLEAIAAAGELGSLILAGSPTAGNDDGNQFSQETLQSVQRAAVERSRLGIPILFGRDVIHGHRTVFPIPLAQAASFDPEVVRVGARVAAVEASADGVHWTFAPMTDISRDPRWGRIAESFGEDPHLAGVMGAAAVRGFQEPDQAGEPTLLACAKHFVGYGGAEGGRDYNTAEITWNTLRNIYLLPFHACCRAGVASIMSAFHDLDGESASGSAALLTGILREEWKWAGFVVSDWGSVTDLIYHGLAADRAEAARIALGAGVDMEMCSGSFLEYGAALVETGRLSESRVDEAVRRVLRAKFRAGLFDRSTAGDATACRGSRTTVHLQRAETAAVRSLVLLKNKDNILPLAREAGSVILVGPYVRERRSHLGCWTLDGVADETPTLEEAFAEVAPGVVRSVVDPAMADQASAHFMNHARTVVCAVGEDQCMTGEHNSVASLDLYPGQVELARRAKERGKRVVALIFVGRPVVLTDLEPWCDAMLLCWHGGSRAAHAVARAVFGDESPAGALPATFPAHGGQVPLHYNYKPTGKPFGRGCPADPELRSVLDKYLDRSGEPLFPFGFGLTYTQFQLGTTRIESAPEDLAELESGRPLRLVVEVCNRGNRDGEVVVQVYVRDCVASSTRPVRELKAFRRVAVPMGELETVRFDLGAEAFGFYGPGGAWRVEPGWFKIAVGTDSRAPFTVEWQLKETAVCPKPE